LQLLYDTVVLGKDAFEKFRCGVKCSGAFLWLMVATGVY
jgi:hypothetical protein